MGPGACAGAALAGRPARSGACPAGGGGLACPPNAADRLQSAACTALGTAPAAREVEGSCPPGADHVEGTADPPASWLRVWDWSPILPAAVLAGWEPLLAALRRIQGAGPADPRAAAGLVPARREVVLAVGDLVELAAARGPVAACRALAAAEDSGADGYASVLHRLVAADLPAWTAEVPAVLQA